jgi:opacity protein-like surface antigen
MKKILFATASIAAFTFSASAQRMQSNALKMNPVSLLVKTGNISYERAIASNQSVQVGAFYSGVSFEDVKYSGFGITPEYRFYFGGKKQALNGGYVAPFLRYQDFTMEKTDLKTKADFTTLGGGATIGWQKTWDSGFIVDFFAGPSYNHLKFDVEENIEEFDVKSSIKGFGLRTGVTIGFTF